jgi:23S rRNA pseudouridine1911/1915/1917 synthase
LTLTLQFTADTAGLRMDRYLDSVCPDLSRSRLQQLIAEGNVTLDNKATTKAATRLKVGQILVVTVPEPVESPLLPQDIPVDVVYQDSDVIVVDKPAGLTVHPGPGHPDGTLVNALLAMCPDLQGIGGTVRPGIVHRLDKDTSGLMVVAKNEVAHRKLSDAMKARDCKKVYIVLVHGSVKLDEAAIEAPIGRDPANRKRMAIVGTGRQATTRYRVTQRLPGYTLVDVTLVTGRTHQIRVHFASIGHPPVGDEVYGRTKSDVPRQFLHAHKLGFELPSTGEYKEFESPLPQDLDSFLQKIREG